MQDLFQTTEIVAGASYPLKEFQRRTSLGSAAIRRARKDGLKVRRVGRHSFILGEDWLEHLQHNAKLVG